MQGRLSNLPEIFRVNLLLSESQKIPLVLPLKYRYIEGDFSRLIPFLPVTRTSHPVRKTYTHLCVDISY